MKQAVFTTQSRPRSLPGQARAGIRATSRITLIFLAAAAATRLILFAIDIAAARTGPPGGEITIPFYVVLLVCAGWKLREWTSRKPRGAYERQERRLTR